MATKPKLSTVLTTHFDPAQSKLSRDARNSALLSRAFGFGATPDQLAGVCGAPSGSTIRLDYRPKPTKSGDEIIPPGVQVLVENPTFFTSDACFVITATSPTTRGIYIKSVMAKKAHGLAAVGALMMRRMVASLDALPSGGHAFGELRLFAAGGRTWSDRAPGARWDGFAVWPRYGFDMPLAPETATIIKDEFPYHPRFSSVRGGCKDVSQVLGLDKGLDFWDLVGDGNYMRFDLAAASPHRARLDSYLAGKYA